jgi:hypothetical protein
MRFSTILQRSRQALAGTAQPRFRHISNIARSILECQKVSCNQSPSKLKLTVRPIVEQIPYLPRGQILKDGCVNIYLAGESDILTFKLQLRYIGLQENVDFGGGLFHTFLDWYWHPFQQLAELKFLLRSKISECAI